MYNTRLSLGSNGGGKLTSDKTQARYCCPFCEDRLPPSKGADTNYHLYVNVTRGKKYGYWICHRCGAKGRNFFDQVGEQPPPSSSHRTASSRPDLKVNTGYPCEVLSVSKYTPDAYEYLTEIRGIDQEKINYYQLVVGTSPPYHKRIFFPDVSPDGEVLFWVARSIDGWKPKYTNPEHAQASKRVHYLTRVREEFDEVIITEGVISAIQAGRNAVAMYGKDVSPEQLKLLVGSDFDRYYVALDGDTVYGHDGSEKEALQLHQALCDRGCESEVVVFPEREDPASVEDFGSWLTRSCKDTLDILQERIRVSAYKKALR